MITHYQYCGVLQGRTKRVWAAFSWKDEWDYIDTYIIWGSVQKPQIKKYNAPSYGYKDKRTYMKYKIQDKRSAYSGYTEIPGEEVKNVLPGLETEIGMYFLAKKLKGR